ncbi:MAG: dihydropyrimidinase [Paracoccaceae bacterium]|nr:dihydropyrimidinase [Paracoccaceae bacterium]
METYDLVLRGGRVISANSNEIADIAIRGGRIGAVGDVGGTALTEIDCGGKVVTPGGVDVHSHIEQMSGMGLMCADTFETATRSAAIGGTTTVVSHMPQLPGQRLSDAMDSYATAAKRGAAIDHAFHMIVSDLSAPAALDDLAALIRAGHRSIKVFTTYAIQLTDREICEVISVAKAEGALVCVHAENDGLIGWTKDRLIASGKVRPEHHATSHPRLAEIDAVERMIRFAEFFATPIMLFHISTSEGVEAVRNARARGVPVWAETCPHYLFMDASALQRDGLEGAKWMCSPPQRRPADQTALWEGLADGSLDLISSDHAPYRFDETGKLAHGDTPNFGQIANGLPGLEVRMPLIFDAAFSRRLLSPTEFVNLTATAPARIHGLPRKGQIAPGFDADITVWDPDRTVTFDADDLHDNVGYNPWEGRTIQGWPETVFLRGKAIVENGAFAGSYGTGRWIRRDALGVTTAAEPASEYLEATS